MRGNQCASHSRSGRLRVLGGSRRARPHATRGLRPLDDRHRNQFARVWRLGWDLAAECGQHLGHFAALSCAELLLAPVSRNPIRSTTAARRPAAPRFRRLRRNPTACDRLHGVRLIPMPEYLNNARMPQRPIKVPSSLCVWRWWVSWVLEGSDELPSYRSSHPRLQWVDSTRVQAHARTNGIIALVSPRSAVRGERP